MHPGGEKCINLDSVNKQLLQNVLGVAVAVFTFLVNSSTVYVSPLFIDTWDPSFDSVPYIQISVDPRFFVLAYTTRPLDLDDFFLSRGPSITQSQPTVYSGILLKM